MVPHERETPRSWWSRKYPCTTEVSRSFLITHRWNTVCGVIYSLCVSLYSGSRMKNPRILGPPLCLFIVVSRHSHYCSLYLRKRRTVRTSQSFRNNLPPTSLTLGLLHAQLSISVLLPFDMFRVPHPVVHLDFDVYKVLTDESLTFYYTTVYSVFSIWRNYCNGEWIKRDVRKGFRPYRPCRHTRIHTHTNVIFCCWGRLQS